MILSSNNYHFGVMKQGDSLTVEYKFYNAGTSALVVNSAECLGVSETSCIGVRTEYTTNSISPNDTGCVKIHYNSTGKLGKQNKTIIVSSNSSIDTLHLEGVISTDGNVKSTVVGEVSIPFSSVISSSNNKNLNSFWGIPFGSPKSVIVEKLKSKGITLTSEIDGNITTLSSSDVRFGNKKSDLLLIKLINNKFSSASLYYPTDNRNIKSDFNDLFEDLQKKYSIGDKYSEFKYPYKEGDDDEEFALSSGYGELSAYWLFEDASIMAKTLHLKSSNVIKLEYQDNKLVKEAIDDRSKTSDY